LKTLVKFLGHPMIATVRLYICFPFYKVLTI
jgi:hypothetical protein